ncbi:hypothetical protein [Acuticoccus mangrovi]|uniref:Uncharacterized protein n=1 Tax=Acuticoccus mangrovi TaxID=2796142 RepID=A0A934IN51_9HYPH|nr:hypothetical protein [Acuticoccus mangrovi]MBJ3775670.1 hypothetical protein [Acuticoccus mangrovi]
MATREEHQQIADRLSDVLRGAAFAQRAEGELAAIQIDANAMGLVQTERDYLHKAITSVRAALRQKGPRGDNKRRFAREDISKFASVGSLLNINDQAKRT